jgi:hypothetical protein
MRYILLGLFLLSSVLSRTQTPCGHPIISEYVEGSSNNKCIEIYNPTSASINLAGYQLTLYSNGSGTPSSTVALSGTLASGATYVVCNASQALAGVTPDLTSGVCGFNGDDVIALRTSGGAYVDIVGNVGCDPGTQWSSGSHSTLDKTLTRNANICCGVSADPGNTPCDFPTMTTEWTATGTDTHSLGSHTCDCPACTPVGEPAASASNAVFTDVFCNEMTFSWTNGSGAKRVVAMSENSPVDLPADGAEYAASAIFGSGTLLGADSYVVYSGTGSTGTIYNLTPGTTYYFAVVEYDGFGACVNYQSVPYTVSQATPDCSGCASIGSVIINSCEATCGTEGGNEMVFFEGGASDITVSTANIEVAYGSSFILGVSDIITNAGIVNTPAATLTDMNAACGSAVFYDALSAGTIPAGSQFVVVPATYCAQDYDFSALCGAGPIYVVSINNDPDWSATGEFLNSAGGTTYRYFRSTVNGCTFTYYYDANLLGTATDGDYITFAPQQGGEAITYDASGGGCAIPVLVLPVELISLNAVGFENFVELHWVTAIELNSSHYQVQRSGDGIYFENVAVVAAAGNSSEQTAYYYRDAKAKTGVNFYRLQMFDLDGTQKLSKVVHATLGSGFNAEVFQIDDYLYIDLTSAAEYSADTRVEVYDASGKLWYQDVISNYRHTVSLSDLPSGLYIVLLRNENSNHSVKFVRR